MQLFIWWAIGLSITTFGATWLIRKYRRLALPALVAFFATYVISANVLVPRLVEVNIPLALVLVPTGSVIWPFTAQIIDMVNEVYGRAVAYASVAIAFASNLLFVTFVFLASSSSLNPIWPTTNEAFWNSYFQPAPRILLASMASAIICIALDIYIFDRMRRKWELRESHSTLKGIASLAALRAVTSDMLNMVLDGFLFAIFAFAFVMPVEKLLNVAFGSVTFKLVLVIVDKPWFIAFRLLVRGDKRGGEYENR